MRVGEEHRLCPDPASRSWKLLGSRKVLWDTTKHCRQSPGSVLASRSRYSIPGLLTGTQSFALELGLCLWLL